MVIRPQIRFNQLGIDQGLLFIATALLPVYTFNSGGIQPAHAFFAFFILLTSIRYGITTKPWAFLVLCLFVYAFFRESAYILVGGSLDYLINAVYLGYNFFLVSAVYKYVLHNGMATIISGLIFAVIIVLVTISTQGITLTVGAEGAVRSVGTFNNPNQLGYFSVCLLSLTYLSYLTSSISYRVAITGFCISIALSIISLSKAAIVANFVLLFIVLVPRNVSFSHSIIFGSALILCGYILFQVFLSGAMDDLLVLDRFMKMGQESDSSLSSRGYFAVLGESDAEIIFGLGSEKIMEIVGHEVHSTFGSIFNIYGVLGLLLILAAFSIWSVFIWRAFGLRALVCLIGPAMLYGITHNGIRFSIFWILFASSAAMAVRTVCQPKRDIAKTSLLARYPDSKKSVGDPCA